MIREGVHYHGKFRGVEFPVDLSARWFLRRLERETIPFEAIGREEVKLKAIPVSLWWASHGGVEEVSSMVGGGSLQSNRDGSKEPTRQRPWFQLPPKVQIVPGILGRAPFVEPHIIHLGEGNPEVRDGGDFGHHSGASFSQIGFQETPQIQIRGLSNPNLATHSLPQSPPPAAYRSTLARFIGHL
jgi:hypothetical protein